MLGRWAKLITPSFSKRQGVSTPGPDDLSSTDRQFASSTTPLSSTSHSVDGTSSTAPTPAASDTSLDKEPCGWSQHNAKYASDPKLPAAVAALQTRLQRQPGLTIDVPLILSTFQNRFQQVSSSIQNSSVAAERKDHNIWSMSALKVLFTRAKLERWADLVAAGTEALTLEDRATQDAIMGDVGGNPLHDGFLEAGMAMPDLSAGMDPSWMMDLMPGSDPSTWFDGYVDWSTVVMNSMGSMEQ